jgi:hypothetical protein
MGQTGPTKILDERQRSTAQDFQRRHSLSYFKLL